jgi:hypothetical protein
MHEARLCELWHGSVSRNTESLYQVGCVLRGDNGTLLLSNERAKNTISDTGWSQMKSLLISILLCGMAAEQQSQVPLGTETTHDNSGITILTNGDSLKKSPKNFNDAIASEPIDVPAVQDKKKSSYDCKIGTPYTCQEIVQYTCPDDHPIQFPPDKHGKVWCHKPQP